MGEITCISPVDGSVYATRPTEAAESVRERLAAARGGAEGMGGACRSPSGSSWCARGWRGSSG